MAFYVFTQYRCTGSVKGHTSTRICLFLLVTEHSTAYCTKLNPCSLPLLCFLLGSEPTGRQATILYTRVQTHAHKCKSIHWHAEILAHNNPPQHEHPHTNTHLNDTVTHSARHRWLSQPLSNIHHNTGGTVRASLQGVACCGNCNRWNCSSSSSSRAGKVKRNRTSHANVCALAQAFTCIFHPDYFRIVLHKS